MPTRTPLTKTAVTILHRLLGGTISFAARIDGARLVIRDVVDVGSHGLESGRVVELAETMGGIVERTHGPAVCKDPESIGTPFERALGARTGVCVPIILRSGTVVGVLSALDRAPRSFAAADVDLVVDLARVISTEIEEGISLDRAVELERVRLAGLLARGLAHDFGNVVSSALANVRSLARILEGSPVAREPLEEISASLEAGRELVARLRDVGRSDSGKVRRRGIDPTAIASKVVALARALFKSGGDGESGAGRDRPDSGSRASERPKPRSAVWRDEPWVDLRLVPPDDPLEIRGDEHAIEQALLNLVLNARDAIAGAGGRVTVRVIAERLARADLDHPWHTPGDWVLLAVDDDGPGVSDHVRERMFEPGFTTKGEKGTGLGLFLVQTTATAHGGGVLVEKSPEGGARLAICLPARPRGSQMMSAVSGTMTAVSGTMSAVTGKRDLVLVADDERGLRRACARELSAAGLAVAEAASRAAALEIVEADPKRIVAAIIDRDLGDGSGEDVARRIRTLNPRALVIETSGASDLVTDVGDAVLEKPFDLQKLVEKVVKSLEGAAKG